MTELIMQKALWGYQNEERVKHKKGKGKDKKRKWCTPLMYGHV